MEDLERNIMEVPQKLLMTEARENLSGNWGLAVGTMLVYMLVAGVSGILPFITILITGPLTLGLCIWALKMSRNEDPQVGNIFDGFQHFGTALAAYLLMILAVVIGLILLIIPGIIVGIGLSMTMFIIADDPEIGAVDALKKSWAIMDGHKMEYFILGLRFLPWAILCIFTLFIGFLWLAPWVQVTFAKFYEFVAFGEGGRYGENDISQHLVEDN